MAHGSADHVPRPWRFLHRAQRTGEPPRARVRSVRPWPTWGLHDAVDLGAHGDVGDTFGAPLVARSTADGFTRHRGRGTAVDQADQPAVPPLAPRLRDP